MTLVTRREFLRASAVAGAGLVVGCRLVGRGRRRSARGEEPGSFAPNAWVRVAPDGRVAIWVSKSEMGQGVRTSLAMIVAEELDVDLASVDIRQAPLDEAFGNQDTGGSTSVSTSYAPLRRAGAQARAMLLAAGAQVWGVDVGACRTENGAVVHPPTGRRLGFGGLAARAAELPIPDDPPLKDPAQFRLIGRRTPRIDAPDRVTGGARYGCDVRLPGMRFAALARPPAFGARLSRFDAEPARGIEGVREVVRVGESVAVIADTTWAALEGRSRLAATWDGGSHPRLDDGAIRALLRDAAGGPARVFRQDGNPATAFAGAARRVEAEYELPYLAHASMEPMNCTAVVRDGRCEVWAPTQTPGWAAAEARRASRVRRGRVTLHVTDIGGGFGRRLNPDFAAEAAAVARAVAGTPVQVVWTREDDFAHDFYRPAGLHRLAAALDAAGRLTAWSHRIVSPSASAQEDPGTKHPESGQTAGVRDAPYRIPHVLGEFVHADPGVPVGWWRSVDYSRNVFAQECFMDEVAAAAGRDPVAFRLDLLDGAPRLRRALEVAAERAGWGARLPAGHGRGVAVCAFGETMIAEVAEVTVAPDGRVRVLRVVCAIDCGTVINPSGVEAQVEGGVVFATSAALMEAVGFQDGGVRQTNFHDYPILSIRDVPRVEVHLVPSAEPPSGVGEPPVPPLAPAVANAVFAATGQRVRSLPLRPATAGS